MTTVTPGSEDAAVTAPASAARSQRRGLAHLISPGRITALDAARGLAVLGMITAHVVYTDEFQWARVNSWTDLANGRSAILFAVIAGISLALMTGGRVAVGGERMRSARLRLLGRGAAVFGLGLLMELLNTGIAVILTVYGLLFIAAIPFLGLRRRTLALLAGFGALCGPPLLALVEVIALSPWGEGLGLLVFGTYPITVWMTFIWGGLLLGRSDLRRLGVQLRMLIVGILLCALGGGAAAAAEPLQEKLWEQLDGDILSSSAESINEEPISEGWGEEDSGEWYSIVPGAEIDFSSLECEVYQGDDWVTCAPEGELSGISWDDDDPVDAENPGLSSYLQQVRDAAPLSAAALAMLNGYPHSGGSAEILGSGGFAVALLGLLLLSCRIAAVRWALLPLAALGSMPLTAYCGHVVLYGLMIGALGIEQEALAWGLQAGGLIALALVWATVWGRGPLERLTASIARRADVPRR